MATTVSEDEVPMDWPQALGSLVIIAWGVLVLRIRRALADSLLDQHRIMHGYGWSQFIGKTGATALAILIGTGFVAFGVGVLIDAFLVETS